MIYIWFIISLNEQLIYINLTKKLLKNEIAIKFILNKSNLLKYKKKNFILNQKSIE